MGYWSPSFPTMVETAAANEFAYDMGALTLTGANYGIAAPDGASSVTGGTASGYTLSGGYVYPTSNGSASSGTIIFDNAVTWTMTTTGNDANGRNLANCYSCRHIDGLEVLLESTGLTFGTHWIGLRDILNPDADATAAAIVPAAYTGTRVDPSLRPDPRQGIDPTTGNYIVVTSHADDGATAVIRRMSLSGSNGGIRITGIDFNWSPVSATSETLAQNEVMMNIGISNCCVDNNTFQSTDSTTPHVARSCLYLGSQNKSNIFIIDNTARDFDHFTTVLYEVNNLQNIGNDLRRGWADQNYYQSGGINNKFSWNIIADKKHKTSSNSHPDFNQFTANSAASTAHSFEVIGNILIRGDGSTGYYDGQAIFFKDWPHKITCSGFSTGSNFASAPYVRAETSGSLIRTVTNPGGGFNALNASGATKISPALQIGETLRGSVTLSLTGITGTFVRGNTLTGGTSGATAYGYTGTATAYAFMLSGNFQVGETVSDGAGYSATISAIPNSANISATLDTDTIITVTVEAKGNLTVGTLAPGIAITNSLDSEVWSNTCLIDIDNILVDGGGPGITVSQQNIGYSGEDTGSEGSIYDNVTNVISTTAGYYYSDLDNNHQTGNNPPEYDDEVDNALFGASLTPENAPTSYAIKSTYSASTSFPKAGAHQDYVDYVNRTIDLPREEAGFDASVASWTVGANTQITGVSATGAFVQISTGTFDVYDTDGTTVLASNVARYVVLANQYVRPDNTGTITVGSTSKVIT